MHPSNNIPGCLLSGTRWVWWFWSDYVATLSKTNVSGRCPPDGSDLGVWWVSMLIYRELSTEQKRTVPIKGRTEAECCQTGCDDVDYERGIMKNSAAKLTNNAVLKRPIKCNDEQRVTDMCAISDSD